LCECLFLIMGRQPKGRGAKGGEYNRVSKCAGHLLAHDLLLRGFLLFFRESITESVGPLHGSKAKLRLRGGTRWISSDHDLVSISKGVVLNAAVRQLRRSRAFHTPSDFLAFVVANLDRDEGMGISK
jgi:hypothetical protein